MPGFSDRDVTAVSAGPYGSFYVDRREGAWGLADHGYEPGFTGDERERMRMAAAAIEQAGLVAHAMAATAADGGMGRIVAENAAAALAGAEG